MFSITNFLENSCKFLSVELYLSYFIFLSLAFFFVINIYPKFYFYPNLLRGITLLSAFTTFNAILILLNLFWLDNISFFYQIINDKLALLFKLIVLSVLFLFFLVSFSYIKNENLVLIEYNIIIWLSIIGLLLIISSYDFITLFLALELQGLSLYLLATFKTNNNYSTEAGLKYFSLSSYSTGIALFGISILYGFTGTTNFGELSELFIINLFNDKIFYGIILSIIFISAALFFKLAAVPFHLWAVDVYDGSPSISMLYFLVIPKLGIIALVFKLFLVIFFNFISIFYPYLLIIALLSIIIGNLGALYEIKFKRLIAYSGIANTGFILLGFALYNVEGLQAIIFYLIIYLLLLLNTFSIFFNIRKYSDFSKLKYTEDFVSLCFALPILALIFVITLLSLSGIPPLAGFFIKLYLLLCMVKNQLFFLTFVILLINFPSYIYYVRIVRTIFLDNFLKEYFWQFFVPISKFDSFLILTFFLLNLTFFLFFLPIISIIEYFTLICVL